MELQPGRGWSKRCQVGGGVGGELQPGLAMQLYGQVGGGARGEATGRGKR